MKPEVNCSKPAPLLEELKQLMLGPPKFTLAVAESITCGRVQVKIGSVSGASTFFLGGITAYTLDQKVRHLGVARAAALAVNSVSNQVADEMARGVCGLFDADVGVGTTGYAEPSAERSITHPFGWWSLARRSPDGSFRMRSGRIECPGAGRMAAQERVAEAALAALVNWLKEG
jgi:nicotinamide-nucleotide amidase